MYSTSGLNSIDECVACSVGTYCPQPGRDSDGLTCTDGFLCKTSVIDGQTRGSVVADQEACPLGYYCAPAGANYPNETPCDDLSVGEYQNEYGATECK